MKWGREKIVGTRGGRTRGGLSLLLLGKVVDCNELSTYMRRDHEEGPPLRIVMISIEFP
jgi:hypothetical protein